MSVGHNRKGTGDARVTWAGAVLLAAAFVAASLSAAAQAPKTTNDGVYSAAQATRGSQAFEKSCTMCHDTDRFTGAQFLDAFAGKPVAGVFETISTTMPEDNPGSLKPQEYADIVAFFLQLNKYPAGSGELPATAEALRTIDFARRP